MASNRSTVDLFEALNYRGESEVRDLPILQVPSHGLRAGEVCKLNTQDYDGRRLAVLEVKWGSDGKVPLKPEAIASMDAYLGWKIYQGFLTAPDAPIFMGLSNNGKGNHS